MTKPTTKLIVEARGLRDTYERGSFEEHRAAERHLALIAGPLADALERTLQERDAPCEHLWRLEAAEKRIAAVEALIEQWESQARHEKKNEYGLAVKGALLRCCYDLRLSLEGK